MSVKPRTSWVAVDVFMAASRWLSCPCKRQASCHVVGRSGMATDNPELV